MKYCWLKMVPERMEVVCMRVWRGHTIRTEKAVGEEIPLSVSQGTEVECLTLSSRVSVLPTLHLQVNRLRTQISEILDIPQPASTNFYL